MVLYKDSKAWLHGSESLCLSFSALRILKYHNREEKIDPKIKLCLRVKVNFNRIWLETLPQFPLPLSFLSFSPSLLSNIPVISSVGMSRGKPHRLNSPSSAYKSSNVPSPP